MNVLFDLGVSARTLVDKWFGGSSSIRKRRSVKGALHEGVQDIGVGENAINLLCVCL